MRLWNVFIIDVRAQNSVKPLFISSHQNPIQGRKRTMEILMFTNPPDNTKSNLFIWYSRYYVSGFPIIISQGHQKSFIGVK